jgi:hypothetical protein
MTTGSSLTGAGSLQGDLDVGAAFLERLSLRTLPPGQLTTAAPPDRARHRSCRLLRRRDGGGGGARRGGTLRAASGSADFLSRLDQGLAAGASEVSPVAEERGWPLGRIDDPLGHGWEIGKPIGVWPPSDSHPGSGRFDHILIIEAHGSFGYSAHFMYPPSFAHDSEGSHDLKAIPEHPARRRNARGRGRP